MRVQSNLNSYQCNPKPIFKAAYREPFKLDSTARNRLMEQGWSFLKGRIGMLCTQEFRTEMNVVLKEKNLDDVLFSKNTTEEINEICQKEINPLFYGKRLPYGEAFNQSSLPTKIKGLVENIQDLSEKSIKKLQNLKPED